jgi:hypothetical protein
MGEDTADFVATANASIVLTLNPEIGGVAFLSGASLTEEDATGKVTNFTPLNVSGNSVTFNLPKGISFVQVAVVDGPKPEAGTLAISVDGTPAGNLWTNRPLSRMPGAFFGFGTAGA